MSGSWTTRSAQISLGALTGVSAAPEPTAWWLALGAGSADPALDPAIFTELDIVANYARQVISWVYGGDVYATNNNLITFANLGSGIIRGLRIYDDDPAGNLLWWADLTTLISFSTGHTVNFPKGIIRVGVSYTT